MNFSSPWWELSSTDRSRLVQASKLILLFLVIFSLPFNLFLKVELPTAYVQGVLIDYLIPKLYTFEIPLLLLLFLSIPTLRKLHIPVYICLLFLLLFARQLFSDLPWSGLSHLVHLSLAGLLLFTLRHDPCWVKPQAKLFVQAGLLAAIMLQTLLAIYQFVAQQSLLAYQFFGETQLAQLTNISRGQFFFGERLLAYGSTAHPNILAGIITLFSLLLIGQARGKHWLQITILLNNLLIIYLTQSLSALLTLILFAGYWLIRQQRQAVVRVGIALTYYAFLVLLPLLLVYPPSSWSQLESVYRRQALNQAGWQILESNLVLGVGLNQFTAVLHQYRSQFANQEIIRFTQPVHHVLLLALAEGGLVMVVLAIWWLRASAVSALTRKSLVLLAIISLDHYLLSQAAGLQLVAIFYAFME